MSDEIAKQFQAIPNKEVTPESGRSSSLIVTLHPNGEVQFQIPANKMVAHGLLGMAQTQLAKLELLQELQSQAKAANGGGINGLLKKMGRG